MAKLKIGVFGGARGATMMDELLKHPDAELVAVCDKFVPLLDNIRSKTEKLGKQVACYESFDDFIKHDMDAVVLANYGTEHATFGMRCLDAGMHVMSEVSPCETMAQAVQLIETVERTGLVYTYAENYCYMQTTFEMWQRYRRGDIGEFMYGEGEYIHDCSPIWPQITYGERDHWRNRESANFYNTHSFGPIITITGLRPVRVVGFECPPANCMRPLGSTRGAGMEIVTLENGGIVKSIHGSLKREPGSVNYQVYCQGGMMETGRLDCPNSFNIYKEGDCLGSGNWEKYNPESTVAADIKKQFGIDSHGGSDFYPTHFFIEKILGREDGKWAIDVYTAVDMGICGLLAYQSVLKGNIPIDVPNLRNKEERDAWRNDNACTTPEVAGDQLQPRTSHNYIPVADEAYDFVRNLWEKGTTAGQIPKSDFFTYKA